MFELRCSLSAHITQGRVAVGGLVGGVLFATGCCGAGGAGRLLVFPLAP